MRIPMLRLLLALAALPTLLPAQTEPAPPWRAELGAAGWVAADSAYFGSSMRLGEQWQLLRNSNAMKTLLATPGMQLAIAAVTASAPWRQLEALRDNSPAVDTGIEVLADGLAHEVFVCLDGRWHAFLASLSSLYLDSFVATVPQRAYDAAALRTIVAGLPKLALPGSLIGFRVGDPSRATAWLDRLAAMVGAEAPARVTTETIAEARFHVLTLDAGMLPPDVRATMRRELRALAADDEQMAPTERWLDQLTLRIAAGVRGDYLLLSIGPDTAQLRTLGTAGCLAEHAALEPVRRVCKPGAIALEYVAPALSARQPQPVDALLAWCDAACRAAGASVPAGLADRLHRDLNALLGDLNAGYGDAQAQLSISFLDRGIESYAFQAALPGRLDSSDPLTILEHGGRAPLLLAASRAAPIGPGFERFVHWSKVAYSYFEDFLLPGLGSIDRAEFEQFERAFVPFATQLHAITRDELLPSVDGCQGMFVLDDQGVLASLPGRADRPRLPLRWPRPAIVHELRDGARFTTAWSRYRSAVNDLLATAMQRSSTTSAPPWPAPDATSLANGIAYTYPLPLPGELAVAPCAVVEPARLVLATHHQQAKELLGTSPWPEDAVVGLREKAGAVLRVEIARLLELVLHDVDMMLEPRRGAVGDEQQSTRLLRQHLPAARKLVGALRTYTSRTWTEGTWETTHSWLHIEDIKP